jgi:hypothetical protein
MALALPLELFRRHGLQAAPEAELRAGTGQQPTQFHSWLVDKLGGLGTAAIGE